MNHHRRYFVHRRQKALETAANLAKVEVAEARYQGDVGEAERQAATARRVAEVQAETQKIQAEQVCPFNIVYRL
jgi:flotillin